MVQANLKYFSTKLSLKKITPKRKESWISPKVYDWKNYVPPSRPSKSELKIFEDYVKIFRKKKQLEVAILGCTVEFRSLCHKYKMKVTVIDFSKKHYQILSRQPMKYKGKEIFREEDWRIMSTAKKYDLILGDLVVNVVPTIKEIGEILKNFSQSLKPNGLCILRSWVRENNKRYKIEDVIAQYRKNTPKIHFFTACLGPIYLFYYDFKKEKSNYLAMINGLRRQSTRGQVTKKEFFYCYNRWRHEGGNIPIPLRSVLEKIMLKFFKIKELKYGNDCFWQFAPIHILRKKNN